MNWSAILKFIISSNEKVLILLFLVSYYFDGYRKWTSGTSGGWIITYDGANINTNNVLNLGNGKFFAPQDGIYQFHFLAQIYDSGWSGKVSLRKNNHEIIGTSMSGSSSSWKMSSPVRITAILQLRQGDAVYVLKDFGQNQLFDSDVERYTHFIGLLLQ